MQRKNKDTFIM